MDVRIEQGPAFAWGLVTIPAGGSVRVEAGAMAMMRGDVTAKTSTGGGFFKGLKRMVAGENFFVNDFVSASGGEVGVAATLPGDMKLITLAGSADLMVQSGSWIASDPSIEFDASWGGAKTFFAGEGLVLVKCWGTGDVLVASYGAIVEHQLAAGEVLTIDSGHVVAFESGVSFTVSKAGNWKTTILGAEGLVANFTGPGRVWMQTRSSGDLASWILGLLPSTDGDRGGGINLNF